MNGEEALPCLAADHHASIGMQYLAAHVACIIARQEKEAGGDLIGLARPSHRCALAELLPLFRFLAPLGFNLGPFLSWSYAFYPHSLLLSLFLFIPLSFLSFPFFLFLFHFPFFFFF